VLTRREGREILEVQRSRVIAATIAVVEVHGYSRLTVGRIIERARVSRTTFYDLFEDCEDCLLAAFDLTLAQAREIAIEAYRSQPDWRGGMRAAVFSLLTFIDREPGLARLCMVDVLGAGQRVLDRRAEALQELADAIDMGSGLASPSHQPQPLVAHAIAGGIVGVLHSRLLRKQDASPTELLGALTSMIVMPYLGRAVAAEEFDAPVPQVDASQAQRHSQPTANPLAEIDIRVTYRTVRVLMAIAETPNASNRVIATNAGIVDQGQISKLLRRLEGLELIENSGLGQARGAANSWRLTKLGTQVQRATEGR
jgi:AcrR family transcriptional regulator